MASKYINPFTDFGFKKLFGEEANKDLLLDFLNSILPKNRKIKDLAFKNTEKLGRTETDRKAVFDIFCDGENGEKFIVELQRGKQVYFKDRTVFYSTFPIQEQAQKGEWDYKLEPVYCVAVLNFRFNDYQTEEEKTQVIHHVQLKNQKNQIFYDKLTYIYLELPNFNKKEEELENNIEKWMYFLKNLEDLDSIPKIFKDTIFEKAFNSAELSKMNSSQLHEYEDSLKIFRDYKATINTAKIEGIEIGKQIGLNKGKKIGEKIGLDKGKIKGRVEEKYSVIDKGIERGMSLENLFELTGLSVEEIQKYLDSKNKK